MGWKIPEIRIRVPKVRAGRVFPKLRVRKPASEKITGFSLTVFSSNSAPKGIKKIDVIRALIETNGNRTETAKKLGISDIGVVYHVKKIRRLSDTQLARYANELGITAGEIKRVCIDLDPTKGITHIDVIKALFETGGNRTQSAEKLGVTHSNVSNSVKKIRRLPDTQLVRYANELGTTVGEIKRVCIDLDPTKGITHIDIIKALLETGGNRRAAAKKLGIGASVVSYHAKNIRQLPNAQLVKYAKRFRTTAGKIKQVCADLDAAKGITNIDIIMALLESEGNRTAAAQKLQIDHSVVSYHAKNIMRLPDTELQKYANKLIRKTGRKITVRDIKDVVSPRIKSKINFQRRLQVIKTLIATRGNRTQASKKLGINPNGVSKHANNIRRMSDWELQRYADELKTTVAEIKRLCADLNPTKGITYIDVIKALFETGGNRTQAAKKLMISGSNICRHIHNIRRMSDTQLQKYAAELGTTVNEIKRICADLNPKKGISQIDIIREMLKSNGNRRAAAEKLGISYRAVRYHIESMRLLSEADLAQYAAELGVSVERIKQVCAPRLEQAERLFKK